MVGAGGFEPLTSSVSGRRSNQLSYAPIAAKRAVVNREYTSVLIDSALQCLAGNESDGLAARDFECGAGLRISRDAGLAL